jgi:glutathione synthase/RimK-type ligase-like ATP-grasp enzyme
VRPESFTSPCSSQDQAINDDGENAGYLTNFAHPPVVKIPDGSFSRGIHKADTPEEFHQIDDELFEETDLLLAQKFLPTEFDWRACVPGGERGLTSPCCAKSCCACAADNFCATAARGQRVYSRPGSS